MVLQDLNNSPSDSFTDNPYPSDNDPYSSSSPRSHYNLDSLPRPIPILGPLLGFSDASLRFRIDATIGLAEKQVPRPLNTDEAYAFALHICEMEQVKSYFAAAGLGFGGYRWYGTMAESRFPFFKPKPEQINPNKFLMIKGPLAQNARQSFRAAVWLVLGTEFGKILGLFVGQARAAANTTQDPKLTQFGEELKKRRSEPKRQSPEAHDRREQSWQERITQDRAAKKRTEMPANDDDDDMSPTAGNDPWSSTSPSSWSGSDYSQEAAQDSRSGQQSVSSSNTWNRQTQRYHENNAAPKSAFSQNEAQNQTGSGGSAWERLRRGDSARAQRPSAQQAEPSSSEQRAGATSGDDFTFSGSEDDRRKAQEKAQREFDLRIERERQGKDFDDNKRW